MNTVDRLRRVAAGTAGPADLDWLRGRLGAYLSDPEKGLERAFHLDRRRGQLPWWVEEQHRHRDGLLLRLWREHFPDLSAWVAAEKIATIHQRYVAGAWLHHRDLDAPPDDPMLALLWLILKIDIRFPNTRRRIFQILTTADRGVLY